MDHGRDRSGDHGLREVARQEGQVDGEGLGQRQLEVHHEPQDAERVDHQDAADQRAQREGNGRHTGALRVHAAMAPQTRAPSGNAMR